MNDSMFEKRDQREDLSTDAPSSDRPIFKLQPRQITLARWVAMLLRYLILNCIAISILVYAFSYLIKVQKSPFSWDWIMFPLLRNLV